MKTANTPNPPAEQPNTPPADDAPPPAETPPADQPKGKAVRARVLVAHPHDGRMLECGITETFDAEAAAALEAAGVIDTHPDSVKAGIAQAAEAAKAAAAKTKV